jgi:hypothetical protein
MANFKTGFWLSLVSLFFKYHIKQAKINHDPIKK